MRILWWRQHSHRSNARHARTGDSVPSFMHCGEQRWRSGESARLPPLWPGFDSRTRRHVWVEFVVGSLPCSEGFSPGSPVFLPPQKLTLLNSNSIWKQWMKSHIVEMPLEIPLLLLLLLLLMCGSQLSINEGIFIWTLLFTKALTASTSARSWRQFMWKRDSLEIINPLWTLRCKMLPQL